MGRATIWTPDGSRTKKLDDVKMINHGGGMVSFKREREGRCQERLYVSGVPWAYEDNHEIPYLYSVKADHGNLLLVSTSGVMLMKFKGVILMQPQSHMVNTVRLVRATNTVSGDDSNPDRFWSRTVVVCGPLVSSSLGPGTSTKDDNLRIRSG